MQKSQKDRALTDLQSKCKSVRICVKLSLNGQIRVAYVSLEDPEARIFADTDARGFLAKYTTGDGVIFDEIQRVPQLLSYLQGVVDASDKQGFFVLTGSQNFLLHAAITQTLAGRVALCLGGSLSRLF